MDASAVQSPDSVLILLIYISWCGECQKEKFNTLNVAEHDHYGKGSVMVWEAISVNRKHDLYVIKNGTLMTLRFCNEILDSLSSI